ncbi:MAG: hypothetical protein ABSG75_06115 [Syntrophales bacterium]|jgi:hypothetical protein
MKVKTPEEIKEYLDKVQGTIETNRAKIQILTEHFKCLGGKEDPEFDCFVLWVEGVSLLLTEIGQSLMDVDDGAFSAAQESVLLYSPDPAKIKQHKEYLRSIGIKEP